MSTFGKSLSKGMPNIKSEQRGSVSINSGNFNITISSVDLTKAVVRMVGPYGTNIINSSGFMCTLSTSTNINVTCAAYASATTIYWEVIEFNNVKSLQTGTATGSSQGDQSITISSINPLKAMIFTTEKTTWNAGGGSMTTNRVIDATHINIYTFSSTATIYWQVVEFN